jgi:hypothetical protein
LGRRLGFFVGLVVSIAWPRGARNREHPLTLRATEDTNIVRHTDAGGARGFAEGTRGWWHQEKVAASLMGGLSHGWPDRWNRPDQAERADDPRTVGVLDRAVSELSRAEHGEARHIVACAGPDFMTKRERRPRPRALTCQSEILDRRSPHLHTRSQPRRFQLFER